MEPRDYRVVFVIQKGIGYFTDACVSILINIYPAKLFSVNSKESTYSPIIARADRLLH